MVSGDKLSHMTGLVGLQTVQIFHHSLNHYTVLTCFYSLIYIFNLYTL